MVVCGIVAVCCSDYHFALNCVDLDVTEKEAVALFDFKARNEKELTLKKGDVVQLHTRVSSEWWRGSCSGHTGFIPHNYIAMRTRYTRIICPLHGLSHVQ